MAWTPPADAITTPAATTASETSWTPPSDAEEQGARGLSALYPSTMRGFRGLASLGGDVIPAMWAHAVGNKAEAEKQMQEAAAYGKETEKLYPSAVGSYENIKGLGDFGTYVVEAVGEAIPTLIPSLFTGGAATVAGRGAVVAAKMAAEKAAVAQIAKGATQAEIKAAAMKAGTDAANKVALKYQATGALVGSAAQNVPDVFQNIYEKTGKMDLGTALVAGGFNAALDAVTPVMLLRKAKLSGISPEEIAAAWYKRAGKGVAKGFVTEGGTEAIQEMSSAAAEKFVDNNLNFFTEKNFKRFLDSGLKGGIGGGVITGATDVAFGKGPEKKGSALEGFVPPKDAILTPAATTKAPTPTAKQQARQDTVEQRAQVIEEQYGITRDDAVRMAEDDVAAEEAKIRGLSTEAPDTRVKTRAIELIDSGVEPEQAYATAMQQIQDELEADAQAKEEGALDVTGTKPKPSRKSTGVAKQPITVAPAAGPEALARDGVVPTGEDVGVPAVGEEQQPGALAETQFIPPIDAIETATTQEGVPTSVTTPTQAVETKPKKQKAAAPAAAVVPEVPKVDVAAASVATDPAEIQQHLDAIETEGATLLSKDGRFPKKGTAKRTRLEEIGALKRDLTAKLQPAIAEAPVEATVPVVTQPQGEVSTGIDKYEGLYGTTRAGAIRGEIANNNKVLGLASKRGETELVTRLTQENERLNALLPEAETRDDNDRAAHTDRQILGQAKSELDTAVANGEVSQETAEQLVSEAQETGNVADATEHILSGIDKAETLAIEAPVAEAPAKPDDWYSFVDAAKEQAEQELAEESAGGVREFEGYVRDVSKSPYVQARGPSTIGPLLNAELAEEQRKRRAPSATEEKAAAKAKEKAELASKEEQEKAAATERDAEAEKRAGAIDVVAMAPQILGALQEIAKSKAFPEGIRKDAERYLKEIARASKENEAPEGSLEPAYHFVVAQASKPRFMRTGIKSLPSIGKDKVQAIVDLLVARWKNAPTVVVADNINDAVVPEALQKADAEAKAKGATGVPAGVFYKGKVYIFADQMKSPTETIRTLFHESLGHFGLRGVFGTDLKPILEQVARDHKKQIEAIGEKYGLDLSKEEDVLEAAEEVLANLAQTKPTMGVVQRAVAAVRRFMRRLGMDVTLSNNDLIANYILPARAFVEGQRIDRVVDGAPGFMRTEEEAELTPEEEKVRKDTVRDEQQIEMDVKKAQFKFAESAKAQKAAEGVSALQMAKDPRKSIPAMRALWKWATRSQRKVLANAVPTGFLVDWVGGAIPEMKNTYTLLQRMGGMTDQLLNATGELTNEVNRAFQADETLRGKLDKITSVATLAKIDPAEIDTAERSGDLDKAWKELGPEGQKVYKRIRNHFDVLSKYLSKLLDDQVASLNITPEEKSNLTKKIRATFERGSRINPYFALVRNGDFWLSMGSGENRLFFMGETEAERDSVAREFAAEKIKRKDGESDAAYNKRVDEKLAELEKDSEFEMGDDITSLRNKPYFQGQSTMLSGVFDAIDGINFADPEASAMLKDSIYQTFLETMPDQSFRKQFIHRKGVAGFRVDVLQNTAHTSARMATQLARIKYSPLLRNSLSAAKDSIRGRRALDPFVDAMAARVDNALAPKVKSNAATVVNTLNKASFIYYLSGASSALLQPLSILQTGMPVLSKYGVVAATREMGRMLKVWNQVGMYKTNLDGSRSWVGPSILHGSDMTPLERKAYRAAAERGLFASTAAASVFEYKATPTEKLRGPKEKFARGAVDALVLGGLMNSSERLSRELVWKSSFRLNMQKHGDLTRAINQSVDDTYEALGDYSESARPVFMNGLGGKLLTQFMMFPLTITTFLLKNFRDMIKPMSGGTRAEACHKFFGAMFATYILAGVTGLPMFGTVMGMVGAAWEQLKDDDWPEEMRSLGFEAWGTNVWLHEQLGETKIGGVSLSDLILRGPVNAFTESDIAGRTGLNNLFFRDTKESGTIREGIIAKLVEKAGPSVSMVLSAADGVDAAFQGDYAKAVKKWAPAGFRNFITAHELVTEGATNNKGYEVLSKDAVSTGMAIMQVIGFRPDLLADTQSVAFKVIGAEQKILREHNQLINNLDREDRNRNEPAYQKVLKKIDEFNKKYPSSFITDEEIDRSLSAREENRDIARQGIVPTERNLPFARALKHVSERAAEAERKSKDQ